MLGDPKSPVFNSSSARYLAGQVGCKFSHYFESLNHKNTMAIYARLDLDPVRDSVNTANAEMIAAGALKDGADLRSIHIKKGSQ